MGFFMVDFVPFAPQEVMEYFSENRYGFSVVDLGITPEDMANFDKIEITKYQDYNRCGDLLKVENEVFEFLLQIGSNHPDIASHVAARVSEIAQRILLGLKKDTAWVFLRATPIDLANASHHWHFDWPFYNSKDPQYRFVITLKGPTTLFYPLSLEEKDLRKRIYHRMNDLQFLADICDEEKILHFPREFGVLFLNREMGALHTEPVHTDQSRLFLSIVPCNSQEMIELEARVRRFFDLPF
jgi:hypothetical protein